MELRRARPKLFWIAFFLVGGLGVMWASQNGWELRLLFIPVGSVALLVAGLLAFLVGVALVASAFRPTPIVLDESGLRLRVAGINRSVPWSSVDAMVLEPHQGPSDGTDAPRLLLVPTADADLGVAAEYRNTVDGRPSVVLLGLDSLADSPDQVIRAFVRYAGRHRFVNGVSGPAMPTEAPGPAPQAE
ncbi:hypothetical protein [Micromonospora zhanjiangensis]|uniref:PH domain-containing protein n=1 Tax=Micromonospora zhanjiangensis TaxID=1522057 RepID=A0ABV8KSS7_9ACTN